MIVEAIESNGFDKHVTFQFSGRQITSRLPSHAEPVVGETRQVALDLSHISLFDEQSEIRISRYHRRS
jgi:ABC-type sugar transport system ATPase subunit